MKTVNHPLLECMCVQAENVHAHGLFAKERARSFVKP